MVQISESEGIEGCTFVVTGGLHSVGAALCLELVRRGAEEVRCFDPRTHSPWLAPLKRNRVLCVTGDVRQKQQVDKVLRGAGCVFHLASYGMYGKEMLQARQIDEVNLQGTLNVLECCIKCGVERLVFISSYNVVFGGQTIINGNEEMDYYPLETQIDAYGRSKSLAEQLVLRSNNSHLKNKSRRKLFTCSIRPAAVYGPGEEYHMARILSLVRRRILPFLIGGPTVKTDWVYIDNLVHGLLLASMGLIDDIPGRTKAPAAGHTFFISDGAPKNSFLFFRPLIEMLGYPFPGYWLSLKKAKIIAWFFWGVYCLFYPWLDKWWLPQPVILPAEVQKFGVTHHFSILKARQLLGYVPFVDPDEGMRRTKDSWKADRTTSIDSPPWYIWVCVIGGLLTAFLCGFTFPPFLGPFEWVRLLSIFLFRTQENVQILFYIASLLHIGEAAYAWHLARKVDPSNANGWMLQTLLLGFFSLRLLLRRS